MRNMYKGGHLNMFFIVTGIICAVIFFAIQFMLCNKGKKTLIKCIPLYLIILGALICTANYLGFFGSYSAGAISGNEIVAIIYDFFVGAAFIGVLLAWMAYGINYLIHNR